MKIMFLPLIPLIPLLLPLLFPVILPLLVILVGGFSVAFLGVMLTYMAYELFEE